MWRRIGLDHTLHHWAGSGANSAMFKKAFVALALVAQAAAFAPSTPATSRWTARAAVRTARVVVRADNTLGDAAMPPVVTTEDGREWTASAAGDLGAKGRELSDKLKGVSIFLVGMMGSGKTSAGELFAKSLGSYSFIDTDDLIEKLTGAWATVTAARRPPAARPPPAHLPPLTRSPAHHYPPSTVHCQA